MRTLTSAYLSAAKAAARYPDVRVTIGTLELTGSREVTKLQIVRGSTSKPSGFVTAEAVGSVGTITIDRRTLETGTEDEIISGENITVEALFRSSSGTLLGSALIYTGIITAYNKQDRVAGIISVTDAMANTGIDYNPEILDYSESGETYISDIAADAFDQAGLPGVLDPQIDLDIDPIVNEPPYKAEEPVAEGMKGAPYTCREVIAAIAGMNLACFFIDAEGLPKLYSYGEPSTTAVTADILTELVVTDETYGLDKIKIFKTSEKMAKTAVNYRVLPYAPRLPEMITLDRESLWYQQINEKKDDVLHWDWMTATATIQGVGEIEPGDRLQFTASGNVVKMFVTGIVYNFENSHFSETLYSFAQTEQEYKMSPPGSTTVTTKSKSESTQQTYYSDNDPALTKDVKAKDLWFQWDSSSGKNLVCIKRRKLVSAGTEYTEPSYVWEVVANISAGGSGVGENIGRHNERFNDYENNTIDPNGNQDYNKLSGYNNHIGAGISFACDVGGSENNLNGPNNVGGLVRGYNNNVGGTRNITSGDTNSNTGSDNITVGGRNAASGARGVTYGESCSNTREDALCGGNYGFTGADFMIAIGNGGFASSPKNIFTVDKFGDVTAHAYNTSSADFAEYFEWADGNPEAADRMGLLVDQIGDKIAPAQGTEFFGAISARASVIGNAYEDYWHGKYITDVYGRIQYDKDGRALISPDFDPSREYVPRSQRPEWAVNGLVGRIIVRDDGSCIPGGYVSARQGIATKCYKKTAGSMLRRIDEKHIEILLK